MNVFEFTRTKVAKRQALHANLQQMARSFLFKVTNQFIQLNTVLIEESGIDELEDSSDSSMPCPAPMARFHSINIAM